MAKRRKRTIPAHITYWRTHKEFSCIDCAVKGRHDRCVKRFCQCSKDGHELWPHAKRRKK